MRKILLAVAVLVSLSLQLRAEGDVITKIDGDIVTKIDGDIDIDSTAMELLMEEIEVKTIKRDRDYIQMPLAVSSIGFNTMLNNSIEGIRDISAVVPNIYISSYGTKLSSSVYIRGVGSRINSPSVGLYVDGMPYYEKSSFDFDFNGIESVEVLRGPQGTLYGRNSMGGVINVYTRSPLRYQGSDFEVRGGAYGEYSFSASHYDTIGEKFGYGVSANYSHKDGFFENLYTGARADKSDQGSARLRLSYKLADSLTMEVMGSIDLVDQLGYAYSVYDVETGAVSDVNYNAPSSYDRVMATAGVALNYTHEKFKLSSQTSFLYVDDDQGVDQDFTADDLYYAIQKQKQNTISQEINISGRKGRYSWLVGAFGFFQQQRNQVSVEYRQMDMYTDKYYQLPTFGTAFYHQSVVDDILTKGLSLTLGIRYDFEKSSQDYQYDMTTGGTMTRMSELDHSATFNQFMPKAALQYSRGGANLYATVSRGYKAGGFNSSFNDDEEASFQPEYTWNYEVGYKQSMLDGALRCELALFYIDWKDQQVYQTVSTGVGSMLRNAGHSTSKGVEFSLYARPVRSLNLRANYGYTYAKFDDYQKSDELDYSGNFLPFVPRHTVGINADYTLYTKCDFLKSILFGVSYNGKGEIYWDDANAINEGYYGLLNGRIAFALKCCTIELWGRNLTGKEYFAFQFSSMGNNYVELGAPRTIGATLRVNM